LKAPGSFLFHSAALIHGPVQAAKPRALPFLTAA
jgi:hypothetical protein